MPHMPESARLWLDRAEIDYLGPFVKAWASFNAWFREASGMRRDADGLRYVKEQPNPVRSTIIPLLRPVNRSGQGGALRDSDQALKFKLLIRDLHVSLDNYRLEITREDIVEGISFRAVCLGRGASLPQTRDYNRLRYRIEKAHGKWKSSVRSIANPSDTRADIEQDIYDIDGLQVNEKYSLLSAMQRSQLRDLYTICNPRPFTDLFAGNGEGIAVGDIEFKCSDVQLFAALIEVIYSMRNALLHGELQPHVQAFAAYEPAYRIIMKFMSCLRS